MSEEEVLVLDDAGEDLLLVDVDGVLTDVRERPKQP
jgi:hypothetical protein